MSKQCLAVFLSLSVVLAPWMLDGCKKEEKTQPQGQQQAQQQAPTATQATPTPDQLYQLVAPIALFPDNLVAQVLAASTYPDQITAANSWLGQNSNLKDGQLMQVVDTQPWDASVKGLTQFPDVLNQMASNLTWTSDLGDAYFNFPQSVMNAVQVMRQRAQQAGNLQSNSQQTVSVQNQAPSAAPAPASSGQPQTTIVQAPPQTIVIQPAQPDVVYVPAYNPTAVYGAPVAAYPGYSTGAMVATGLISFGLGIAVGAAISNNGCCGWGWNSWGCGWHNSTVVYNRNVYVSNSNTFVNRNNYYNRNVNNYNRNNINTNNINRNNVNTNNFNRNNVNNDYRANNFNSNARSSNFTAPTFNQKYNQPQFNNNRANTTQPNRQQVGGGNQPNFSQQNRATLNQNQARPTSFNQSERQPSRGYEQQANRGTNSGAFSNYGQGGNARTNSARGQQSFQGNRGGGGGSRAQASGGGAARAQGGGGGGRRH